jgi:sec-independent protein translocase protein TatA
MLGGIGWQEIILILLLVLLLFGAKRIPEIAAGLGKGIKVFKKEMREVQKEIESEVKEEPPKIEKSEKPPEGPTQG